MGCWLDLGMRRYIVLLLITGIVWAQIDFDKLVLKDGTTFLGEYSKIEGEMVYFKPQNAFDFIPVFVKRIERLELKDGRILYDVSNVKYSLSAEEYQKLSTKEKAIYDAKSKKFLNKKIYFPKSILTDSEKEIYEQAYSKALLKRTLKYSAGITIITGAVIFVIYIAAFDGLSLSGGGGGNGFTGLGP